MAKPYLYERQTEYWTSRGIEDFYADAGFEIVTFPLSMKTETIIPFDFVFFEKSTCKIFGIQYKTLYHNDQDFWMLNEGQHFKLQKYRDWAYYCLSEMTSAQDHRIAIHKSIFVPVKLNFTSKLYVGKLDTMYYRWGGFIGGLKSCTIGQRVTSRNEIEEVIYPLKEDFIEEIDKNLIDLFIANLEERRLLHLSGS